MVGDEVSVSTVFAADSVVVEFEMIINPDFSFNRDSDVDEHYTYRSRP